MEHWVVAVGQRCRAAVGGLVISSGARRGQGQLMPAWCTTEGLGAAQGQEVRASVNAVCRATSQCGEEESRRDAHWHRRA